MTVWVNGHTHRLPVPPETGLYNLDWKQPPPDRTFPGVFFSAGIHPADSDRIPVEKLRELLRDFPVCAVGECGLDRLSPPGMETQKECFLRQIELAREASLPMVIHSVRTAYEILHFRKLYWKEPQIPWLIHGFRSGAETGRALVEAGCILSLSGVWLMHQRSFPDWLPDDSFLLETDDSADRLEDFYIQAASLRGETPEVLAERLWKTFSALIHSRKTPVSG